MTTLTGAAALAVAPSFSSDVITRPFSISDKLATNDVNSIGLAKTSNHLDHRQLLMIPLQEADGFLRTNTVTSNGNHLNIG